MTDSLLHEHDGTAGADSRSSRRGYYALVFSLRLLIVAVVIGGWELSVRTGRVNDLYVSSPLAVLDTLVDWVTSERFTADIASTFRVVFVGWVLAAVIGMLIGFTLAAVPVLDRFAAPFVDAANAAPRIALVPLFILWLGIGFASQLALILSVNVIITLIIAASAAKGVDEDLLNLARSLGAGRRRIALLVILPWCTPSVFAALRLGLGYAFAGGVVAEFLGSRQGLGTFIARSSNILDVSGVLAGVVVITVVAIIANQVLVAIERRALRWQRP